MRITQGLLVQHGLSHPPPPPPPRRHHHHHHHHHHRAIDWHRCICICSDFFLSLFFFFFFFLLPCIRYGSLRFLCGILNKIFHEVVIRFDILQLQNHHLLRISQKIKSFAFRLCHWIICLFSPLIVCPFSPEIICPFSPWIIFPFSLWIVYPFSPIIICPFSP